MADQTNPYTQLGMMGMMMPNPYTQYGGKALPIPGYMGTPTDAQGNPIQSYIDAAKQQPAAPAPAQGTTLNSTPQQPQFLYQQTSAGGMIPSGENTGLDHPQYNPATYGYVPNPAYQAQPAAPAAPAAPAGPDMRQAYLTALSNPGKVTDPGATVPQAQPLGSPSVMNAFLAANPSGGGSGAGGYNNQGFFQTLDKLRAS
jgi:hypothetical protein